MVRLKERGPRKSKGLWALCCALVESHWRILNIDRDTLGFHVRQQIKARIEEGAHEKCQYLIRMLGVITEKLQRTTERREGNLTMALKKKET